MKYLSFIIPGGNSSNPADIPIDPIGGMPSGGPNAVIAVQEIIRWGVTSLLVIASLIALFFLIFGGIQWIISGGEKTKVETARKRITFSIIGLVIAFLAYFIINIVGGLFGVNLLNPQCPPNTHPVYSRGLHCLPN